MRAISGPAMCCSSIATGPMHEMVRVVPLSRRGVVVAASAGPTIASQSVSTCTPAGERFAERGPGQSRHQRPHRPRTPDVPLVRVPGARLVRVPGAPLVRVPARRWSASLARRLSASSLPAIPRHVLR